MVLTCATTNAKDLTSTFFSFQPTFKEQAQVGKKTG